MAISKRILGERILNRINSEVEFFLTTNMPTCRNCAEKIGVSKSTVHIDITHRFGFILYWLDSGNAISETYQYLTKDSFDKISMILDTNKVERAARGGEATRLKYMNERNKNNENKSGV